ncbi:MAG: hypothetical protein IPJ76_18165 [Flavobacteriales bacterium]|nr:MAG: hypothetical protein IPJ76_18165 [Flavobacteriales bacterium]
MYAYLIIVIPGALVALDFIGYLLLGRHLFPRWIRRICEYLCLIVLPFFYLFPLDDSTPSCCNPIGLNPDHLAAFMVLTTGCIMGYGISVFREQVFPPVAEMVLQLSLLTALLLNLVLGYHLLGATDGDLLGEPLALIGNGPIILLFLMRLADDHKKHMAEIRLPSDDDPWHLHVLRAVLMSKALAKYPVLTLLCLPFLVLFSLLMLLFGQQPDALIRVFTETYKHGFSQLDDQCINVVCGGHYLCTVAAHGDAGLVKPQRYGVRGDRRIICNRQLLVANAFEQVLEERTPRLHRAIRKRYDRVGDFIIGNGGIFRHKAVSNITYVLMKPLEWCFLLVLYSVDKRPEDRIALQYTSRKFKDAVTAQ